VEEDSAEIISKESVDSYNPENDDKDSEY